MLHLKIISAALIRGRRSLKNLISNAALIRGRRSIGGGAQTSTYGMCGLRTKHFAFTFIWKRSSSKCFIWRENVSLSMQRCLLHWSHVMPSLRIEILKLCNNKNTWSIHKPKLVLSLAIQSYNKFCGETRVLIGGRGWIFIYSCSVQNNVSWNELKNNWFQKKFIGQNTNIWIFTPHPNSPPPPPPPN